MRIFILPFIFIGFFSLNVRSQESVRLPDNYFRSNPFQQQFSAFLQHLLNDPTLINKTVRKKTDSTLFFLEGDYSSHNPYFFKSTRCRIILSEKEEVLVADTLSYVLTVYNYQIIGYAPPGEAGIKDIKEEFERCCRKFKKGFSSFQSQQLTREGTISGAIRDYSFVDLPYYPLTLAWATSADGKDNLFAITLRFQVVNNVAFIPTEKYVGDD